MIGGVVEVLNEGQSLTVERGFLKATKSDQTSRLPLDAGFQMSQFSVYLKVVSSREKVEALFDRIERNVPPQGSVHCISITDKQFGNIRTFNGLERKDIEKPKQLTFL